MLFNIFRFCTYTFALQQFCKIWFPTTYNQTYNLLRVNTEKTSIFLIYYYIYIYSKLQILFRKSSNNINEFLIYLNIDLVYIKDFLKDFIIFDDKLFNNEKYNYISFIKDGEITNSIIINNNDKKDILEKSPSQYDFLIYYNFENNTCNSMYHSIPDKFKYEYTNYKFIQIEVILSDKCFFIELSNNHYNFYMENNWVDDLFILHLLKLYYKMDYYTNEYLLNYRLSIIDQDVNILEVDNTDIIYFELNKYVIKKKNQTKCILEEAKNRKITETMKFSQNDLDVIVENEYVEIEK